MSRLVFTCPDHPQAIVVGSPDRTGPGYELPFETDDRDIVTIRFGLRTLAKLRELVREMGLCPECVRRGARFPGQNLGLESKEAM